MAEHDPLCPILRPNDGKSWRYCHCHLINEVRTDERQLIMDEYRDRNAPQDAWFEEQIRDDERIRLRNRAATATVTLIDGMSALEIDDPYEIGWVPVSIELIEQLISGRNADTERIRIEERERIAKVIEALGVPFMIPEDAAKIARSGGRDE